MKLYLCEKPSQGADVAKFLGMTAVHKKQGYYQKDDVAVTWAVGHIFEMNPPEHYNPKVKEGWKLELLPVVPQDFYFEYTLKDNHKRQFKAVKSLLKKSTEVVIATDPDPEGERISRTILKFAGYKGTLLRVLYSSTDDASLTKAFANPIDAKETEWMDWVSTARAQSDWLVGMNLTMALTVLENRTSKQKNKGAFRCGRVKTPLCMLVLKREVAIKNFVPVEHYAIEVDVKTECGASASVVWEVPSNFLDENKRLCKLNVAKQLVELIKKESHLTVTSAEKKEKSQGAPLPYSQTSLQVACDKFGIDAQETLDTCQSLYTKPLSNQSYPRTDIQHLPTGHHGDGQAIIDQLMKVEQFETYSSLLDASRKSRAWNDKKVDVHHGIIPTKKSVDFEGFTEKQKVVFTLVAKRYLSQFAAPYRFEHTEIKLALGQLSFKATCNVPIEMGWKAIEKGEAEEGESTNTLPSVSEGDMLKIVDARIVTRTTKPPVRYSTSTLAEAAANIAKECDDPEAKKTLSETDGIGTGATRASMIDDCVRSGLLVLKGKKLQPSSRFTAMEPFIPNEIKDPATSALWERAFKGIQDEKITINQFVQMQANYVRKCVEKIGSVPRPQKKRRRALNEK